MVISGQWDWCLEQLEHYSAPLHGLWLGEQAPAGVTTVKNQQVLHWLGQECEQLIINGFDGIDLNALGAITGTLKAGGVCYLLCPDLDTWPQQSNSRLTRHLVNTMRADNNLLLLEQIATQPIKPKLTTTEKPVLFTHPVYKTEQQQIAVEKIKKVATGHRRRPLVLTADRGRGKSSALGVALSELLLASKQNVIISAPQVASVSAVFARAVEMLTVIKQTATELVTAQGRIRFIAPDELIRQKYTADLVMIDEAAAIPAPMLTQLLQQYSRIVFTSTIHGYEGTGRGFEIRFKQTLNQLTPNWQAYAMDQPIRWAQGDPLEQFINQALMLNAQAATIESTTEPTKKPTKKPALLTRWDRDKLLTDTAALSQIFGLLTLAHYKTSPNDFRHLLDGANIQLYTLTLNQAIVGTALIAIEGNLAKDLCQQIWQGERRPKGHLLPQTLSAHSGFITAPRFSYARVIRIAIHPDLQGRGLGSQLLQQLDTELKQQKIDFIGSSFGATSNLLRFWQHNQMTVVRLGITVEATSNEYSAVVLRALNDDAKTLLNAMQNKFDDELPRLLSEFYPLLNPELTIQLLQQQSVQRLADLTPQQLLDVNSFTQHRREYEFATRALWQLTLLAIAQGHTAHLNQQQQGLLVSKVLRQQSWSQLCSESGLSGKKAAVAALRGVFQKLNEAQTG